MANDLKLRIASDDPRLKRNINHDWRSAFYPVDTAGLEITDVNWSSAVTEPFNQGELGECTAEAATRVLSTRLHWLNLTGLVQRNILNAVNEPPGQETFQNAFYHDETVADDYDGTYPPDDTGSDGLTSAKVAKARGYIGGYQHGFSAEDAIKFMQVAPCSWGTLWKSDMDDVNENTGQIKYSGTTRGGHQMCLYRVIAAKEQLWGWQSWGDWGYQRLGVYWISFEDFAKSLKDQGDTTFFTPLNVNPTPQPIGDPDGDLVRAGNAWEKTILSRLSKAGKMRTAFDAWKASHGY